MGFKFFGVRSNKDFFLYFVTLPNAWGVKLEQSSTNTMHLANNEKLIFNFQLVFFFLQTYHPKSIIIPRYFTHDWVWNWFRRAQHRGNIILPRVIDVKVSQFDILNQYFLCQSDTETEFVSTESIIISTHTLWNSTCTGWWKGLSNWWIKSII